MIDPLVRGIYYMYLVAPTPPGGSMKDSEAAGKIMNVLEVYRVPMYSSTSSVRNVLVKELKRRSE